MSLVPIIGLTFKLDRIQLSEINQHPEYEHYNKLLALEDNLLPSECLSEVGLETILLMHMIMVIPANKAENSFHCVGGIRTLMMARTLLPHERRVTVVKAELSRKEDIGTIVCSDVLLSAMLFSVTAPALLGHMYMQSKSDYISGLLVKDMSQKKHFARKTGFSVNTLFPPKSDRQR